MSAAIRLRAVAERGRLERMYTPALLSDLAISAAMLTEALPLPAAAQLYCVCVLVSAADMLWRTSCNWRSNPLMWLRTLGAPSYTKRGVVKERLAVCRRGKRAFRVLGLGGYAHSHCIGAVDMSQALRGNLRNGMQGPPALGHTRHTQDRHDAMWACQPPRSPHLNAKSGAGLPLTRGRLCVPG